MAQTNPRNGDVQQECESFQEFFECWLIKQSDYLEELVEASNEESEEHVLRVIVPLIEKVVKHYEHYYNTKSKWAKHEVFAMLHPSWLSTFEDAFLWIGGWRPSIAFHLLYAKSGLQLEAGLAELLQSLQASDLAGISAAQLRQIDELQAEIIKMEREITEKMAKHQETVADPSMVELSHIATELLRASSQREGGVEENRIESTLEPKGKGLVEILQKADDLRVRTLTEVLNILTPIQSIHFLIAAAELQLRIHDWGKRRDDVRAGMVIPEASGDQ